MIGAATAAAALALTGCAAVPFVEKPATVTVTAAPAAAAAATPAAAATADAKLGDAARACLTPFMIGEAMGDGGGSMFLDGAGKYEGNLSSKVTVAETGCVLSNLKAPDSVVNNMSHTTAMMGQQQASWDDVNATWTYHPDNGLDIQFTLVDMA